MSKRRSRKLIDYEVQTSLVVRLCVHWVLFMLATAIAMFLWVRLIEAPVDTMAEIVSKFNSIFIPMFIVAVLLLPVFVLDAVKLSNRFTGPIFRLRRTLATLAEGKPVRPLEFRSNDFWRALANDFNRVVSLTPAADAASPRSDKTNPS
jgi:signal transduction histidine kinase